MKKTILLIILAGVFTGSSALRAQSTDAEQVRATFEGYRKAILTDKGEEAVQFVDSRTIQYYADMLDLAKNADSVRMDTLPVLDKLMVFSVRHRTPREDLLRFDGKALLVYAIHSGMVGKNSVANNSIGEVTVEGDTARAPFVSGGRVAPFSFHFYREAGQWKLDLTSIFSISGTVIQKMVDDSGQSESAFIFSMLEMVTGRKPGPEIWQPVR